MSNVDPAGGANIGGGIFIMAGGWMLLLSLTYFVVILPKHLKAIPALIAVMIIAVLALGLNA